VAGPELVEQDRDGAPRRLAARGAGADEPGGQAHSEKDFHPGKS
jgi:hypothetical protein